MCESFYLLDALNSIMLHIYLQKDVKRRKRYKEKSDKYMIKRKIPIALLKFSIYQQALKLISSPLTECVNAPTDM